MKSSKTGLKYTLQDSVESINYSIPPLRTMQLKVEIAKSGKIANLQDPIASIILNQDEKQIIIDSGDEGRKASAAK